MTGRSLVKDSVRSLGMLLAALALGAGIERRSSADPPATPPLTAEQRSHLKEADRYAAETKKLWNEGKQAEAIADWEKKLALEREVLGDLHERVLDSLKSLANVQVFREEFGAARKAWQELLRARTKVFGDKDWRVTDARLALAHINRLAQLVPEQGRLLGEANQLNQQVVELYGQGKFREAVEAGQRAVKIRKQILGEKHRDFATSLYNLARLYDAMGDYARAEQVYQKAREIFKEVLGERHPDYANSLNNVGGLYWKMGNYAKAEALFQEALEIKKDVLGEKHPDYAASLNNLAAHYDAMGDYVKAEALFQKALEIKKDVLGEKHPDYAATGLLPVSWSTSNGSPSKLRY